MEIFDTNDSFNFDKLILTKPTLISGGNYFIRCLVNNGPLYIQLPKCKTRQGFIKGIKRYSCDLMFTNENEEFIHWMENLENHCQQFIYKNREKWFDGNMELHDIENYFTSPVKVFKSGKYYIVRINANTSPITNKPSVKIYDESENEIDIETINDATNIVTIVEIQGIKCSSRSFQIELELKQMMVLQPTNIFEKCIIKSKPSSENIMLDQQVITETRVNSEPKEEPLPQEERSDQDPTTETVTNEPEDDKNNVEEELLQSNNDHVEEPIPEIIETVDVTNVDGMEEIDFALDELVEDEPFQLKKRNDVYYEMYREARRKAKIARDLALSSYLEAKRIKNTYMLDDIEDSDESDLEFDPENDEENSLDENNTD